VVSVVRPPVIAGLAPGSGTSTLAAALHASDIGVLGQGVAAEADVVVCRAGALRHAAALACAASGPRPVLAVLLDPAGPDAVAQRLAAVRARFAAVVALPHVRRWHGAAIREEAASVLGKHREHLTEPVRAYATALRALVTVLDDSGVLARSAPPIVSRPSTGRRWPGLHTPSPVQPPPAPPPVDVPLVDVPVVDVTVHVPAPSPAELDDEALEALLLPPLPAGRAG
jgi:hypothetical protein